MAEGSLVIVVPVFPDHGTQHVAALEVFHLGVDGLDVLVAGIHHAQGVGQVRNLGHVVPHAVVLAGAGLGGFGVFVVPGSLKEDVLQHAVVHGTGICGIAALVLVAVAMAIEGQAEVHHLVRDVLLGMENVVDGLGAAAALGNLALVQRSVVVGRISFVVGHHVDVVHIRQHTVVVGVLTAVGGRVGQNLVRHGLSHLLEQGDEVDIVSPGGSVHVIAVLCRIGGILPVNVEAVNVVQLTNGHAVIDEGLTLLGVSRHLGPAVGILAPAAHLKFHLELGIAVVLVGIEFLHQGKGGGGNVDTRTVLFVFKTDMTHVDVREVLNLFQRREQVFPGVLRVVNLDNGSFADAGQAGGIVDNLTHGVIGVVRRVGRIGGIRVKGISRRNGAHIGLSARGGNNHAAQRLVRRACIQEADNGTQQRYSKNSRCFHLDQF